MDRMKETMTQLV